MHNMDNACVILVSHAEYIVGRDTHLQCGPPQKSTSCHWPKQLAECTIAVPDRLLLLIREACGCKHAPGFLHADLVGRCMLKLTS